MKRFNKYNLSIVAIVFLLAGCSIDDGDDRVVQVTPKLGTATLNLIMAVTDADGLGGDGIDLYVDETKAGSNMQSGDVISMQYEFPQGTIFRSVIGGDAPVYLTNPIGDYESILQWFTVAELMPEDHNAPLQGQLKNGGSYTLYSSGFGDLNHDFEWMFMVEDDLTAPSGGNAKVRFVNAGGGECWDNTCELSFQVGGTDMGFGIWGGDVFGAGLSSFTDWSEIAPGSLSVDVFDGNGDPYFTGTVNVTGGGIHTIVFSGNETNNLSTPEPYRFTKIDH
ncbi:MAG: hypothetical protein O2887_14880 [Bacteroidetes bacterium]|nr:hypothetical protein [Bacteroidota bacterium]MDA1121751.1 hypothetical protein [Bacteroidota bacterium]